jgi:hypothetical protein
MATLEAGPYRLLGWLAGATGLLAVSHFLPFVDPFLLPPYPTQYHESWNLFALVPHPVWTWMVFGLAVLASVSLIIGKRERLSALVLLCFMSGIIASARPLTSSSSSVFCLLMAFLALMPDAREDGTRKGWAVFGLRLQVFLIYFCGIFFKMADPAWLRGFPLAGTLIGFSWSSNFGLWLSQTLPTPVLNLAGQAILGVEVFAPLAMFFGFRSPLARRAGLLSLTVLHLGMALSMTLEFFPWVMVTILVSFWDGQITGGFRKLGRRLREARWPRIREWAAGLVVLGILITALGQVFLPAVGVPADWADSSVAGLRRQFRFDQHWGMFTQTTFEVDEEARSQPEKTYYATRILIQRGDDSLWDPFTGRASSLKTALLEGPTHPHVSRKAISYFYKSSGSWQERGLRAMARWCLNRALESGISPKAVMIYRYSLPVDFSGSLIFEEIGEIRAKLWYRFTVEADQLGDGEQINPRAIRSIRLRLD